ncbi:MAG: acetoin utilization protein AcuC [Promethearchaeota archaeon]
MEVGFIYTENFSQYNFGSGHPLTPKRIELTYDLMKAYNLFDNPNLNLKLITPRSATEEEVLRIHKANYLNKLKELNNVGGNSYQGFPKFGLGPGDNPIFPGMYDAAMAVCGASLTAADYILEENNSRSFNITGGLHHAMPEMASGFCLLNDVAVAIQHILDNSPKGTKIMYLDIDCHAGDGVQWIFFDRSDVLTLSFHQDGRTLFPGSGFMEENGKGEGKGYSLNVPLLPGTIDSFYLNIFEKLLPEVMDAYKPDYLVCQLGVDTHFTDPITNMGLSTTGHEQIFKIIQQNVPKYCNNKFLGFGGGGYNIGVVARSWTMFLAELLGAKIGDPLPEKWVELFNEKWGYSQEDPPEVLRDQNWRIEEKQLKNPFFFAELENRTDEIVKKYEEEFIPLIKDSE